MGTWRGIIIQISQSCS